VARQAAAMPKCRRMILDVNGMVCRIEPMPDDKTSADLQTGQASHHWLRARDTSRAAAWLICRSSDQALG
jgi:hypothetical protein